MSRIVLILGGSGRFGRHASHAFRDAGWEVRQFNRAKDALPEAARGADVIVNAWNMPPGRWASEALAAHQRVIEVARGEDATVILPGNVYNFGTGMPALLTADTPHAADTLYGRVREDIEQAYRASGTRTIVLRAGDFLDTEASGNWFDRVMVAKLSRGRFTYPGALDVPHAWAFLPDMARAALGLAEIRETLPRFADIPYAGLTLTGHEIAHALSGVTVKTVRAQRMSWMPFRLTAPAWSLARYALAMRYLWDTPHRLDPAPLRSLLPNHRDSGAEIALSAAIQHQIDPDGQVARGFGAKRGRAEA